MDDKTLKNSIENDPFHAGLAEHGEFTGFGKPGSVTTKMLLVLSYIGLLLLMGRAYA